MGENRNLLTITSQYDMIDWRSRILLSSFQTMSWSQILRKTQTQDSQHEAVVRPAPPRLLSIIYPLEHIILHFAVFLEKRKKTKYYTNGAVAALPIAAIPLQQNDHFNTMADILRGRRIDRKLLLGACFLFVFLLVQLYFVKRIEGVHQYELELNEEESKASSRRSRQGLEVVTKEKQETVDTVSTRVDVDKLRHEADKILAAFAPNITCDYARGRGDRQIFYNRIGKAGSSTMLALFGTTIDRSNGVKLVESLIPSDRGSDEFMTRQGELELIQKIVGNSRIAWMGGLGGDSSSSSRSIFVYHVFFLNFTRYNMPMPIYMNLMREPATRYASQYEFWKTLPDIGQLATRHGATMDVCLAGQSVGCPPLNYQTSYFCGHEVDCHDPPTDGSFLQAAKHVVQNYAVVGTLEKLDDFKEQCATLFPEWFAENKRRLWKQRDNAKQASNVNKQNKGRSRQELDAIRQANMYDVLLYELVQKISDLRLTACRKRQ